METISQGLPKLGKINLKPLSSKGFAKILKILDKKKLRKSLFYELGKYFESNIMYNNVVLAGLSLKSFSKVFPSWEMPLELNILVINVNEQHKMELIEYCLNSKLLA